MRQALHIFRKDARHLRWEICLVFVLAVIFARRFSEQSFQVLFAIGSAYLIARAVHAEALPGDRQFWLTRPYGRRNLFAAKILFILIFVSVPSLLTQAYILRQAHFSLLSNWGAILWSQFLNLLVLWLPVAALASVTASIVAFNFTAIALVVCFFLFVQSTIIYVPNDPWPIGAEWMKTLAGMAAFSIVTLAVLFLQYRNRSTSFSRAIAGGALVALVLLLGHSPTSWAMAVESRFSHQAPESSSVQFTLASNAARHFPAPRSGQISADIPLIANGIPERADITIDMAAFELEWSDHTSARVRANGANRQSESANPVLFDVPILLPKSYANKLSDPLTLRASIYVTLFGNSRSETIPLQSKPIEVMDGLQCSFARPAGFNKYTCVSAFRWPDRIVYIKAGDAVSTLGTLVSYSPLPSGVNLDDAIEGRSTSDVSILARQVTITTKEPIAHSRRNIVINNVHLSDFTGPVEP